jgi:hypothetical protein
MQYSADVAMLAVYMHLIASGRFCECFFFFPSSYYVSAVQTFVDVTSATRTLGLSFMPATPFPVNKPMKNETWKPEPLLTAIFLG